MIDSDPRPNPNNTRLTKHARFTWLTPGILRMEWSPTGTFEDRASLAAVHRNTAKVPFAVEEGERSLTLRSDLLDVRYEEDGKPFHRGNLGIRFARDGVEGDWRPGQENTGNLKGTVRSLDQTRGKVQMDFDADGNRVEIGEVAIEDGLLSRDGWALYDDSRNPLLDPNRDTRLPWASARSEDGALDWYFICCGHDYKGTLREAARVFGAQPLPPRYVFGYWYSRYRAYTDREILALADAFATMRLPIDVMVLDMDWHLPGWTGYTWDERFFPFPEKTLEALHRKGLKVTLNLHPADGVGLHEAGYPAFCEKTGRDPAKGETIPFDCADPDYMEAYFECLLRPLERQGVDFWWMDWQQGTTSSLAGLDPLPWLNHTHWMEQVTSPAKEKERPLNFSRYGGLGSGRYPIAFTGDIAMAWETLAYQLWFVPTAGNVLFGYWSSEIGGFFGEEANAELYMRWVQFGLYSPVLRTHSTKKATAAAERRLWAFPDPYGPIMMEAVRERYRFVPYLYGECRLAYEEGLSLCRPLYYEHPEAAEAYDATGQYYFGSQLIAAPIATPSDPETQLAEHRFWLPEGPWIERSTGKAYRGGQWHDDLFSLADTPTFARPGTILPGQELVMNLDDPAYPALRLEVIPGADGDYTLYEDDGKTTDYQKGAYATTRVEYRETEGRASLTLRPSQGDYAGRRVTRPLTVVVSGALPAAVRWSGSAAPLPYHCSDIRNPVGTWHYDAMGDRSIIYLEAVDHSREQTLTLDMPTEPNRHPINGLRGLFHRLETVRELACRCSQQQPLHPDERLPVELAQTANRLSHQPEHFDAEMNDLREKCPRIPALLDALRDALAEQNAPKDAERAHLLTAKRMMEAALAQFLP